MSKVIKVAVIGGGNMGKNHLRTYRILNGVKIVALSDINPKVKQLAEKYGARFYEDYKEMLDNEKPDAVSIVVPTPLHFEIASKVIKQGINLLVEKPIASTIQQAQKLIDAANKAGVIFTVGHVERYNPMVQTLKGLIEKKEIGEITSIVTRRVGGFPADEPKTDVIIDLAVHDIEIISYLLGKEHKKIHGHGSRTLHSTKIDSAELFLDYGDASGFIQANWITPVKIRTIAVTGVKGYVEGNYITQDVIYYKSNVKVINNGFKNFVISLGEPDKEHISHNLEEPLANELEEFIECVRAGKASDKLVKPEAAKEALRVALTALQNQ